MGGNVFFLFRRKERTKEKSFMSFSRKTYLVRALLEGYIREAARISCAAWLAQSQRRLRYLRLRLTLAIILLRFGIPRMDYFCIGRLRPRHVRHPSAAQMDVRR